MSEIETRTYRPEFLHDFCVRVFRHFGVLEDDARQAADVLVASDLRGIDSHGVARLHTYFEMLSTGRINPTPAVKIVRETASTATVDGDNGLGLVVGPKANRIAMDKADAAGSGWVSVCNTNHFGIAGYYVLEALKREQIGIAMTNSTKLVAPLWGAERMLGTNPIAIAFPGKTEPPVVIDLVVYRRRRARHPRPAKNDRRRRAVAARQRPRPRRAQGLLPRRDGRSFVLRAERRELGAIRAAVHAAPGDSLAKRRQGDRPLLRRDADRRFHRPG